MTILGFDIPQWLMIGAIVCVVVWAVCRLIAKYVPSEQEMKDAIRKDILSTPPEHGSDRLSRQERDEGK